MKCACAMPCHSATPMSSAAVPLAKLEAFRAVNPAPLPVKLLAALENVLAPVKTFVPFSSGMLADSLASATVPLERLVAFSAPPSSEIFAPPAEVTHAISATSVPVAEKARPCASVPPAPC